jgi:Protein of unknown function (DUF2971)
MDANNLGGVIIGSDIKPSTMLYRTIPKDRLYELFAKHQNALVRPRMWDDPWENIALNSKVEINGEFGDFGFKDDIYGQCWTLKGFSDAVWRIYSQDKTGVRIRTTVGKLLGSLSNYKPNQSSISCFIGRVTYMSTKQIHSFAGRHFCEGFGTNGQKIAETLLVKRIAFDHENEVRLIYLSPDSTDPTKDVFFHAIDAHQLIDQIMLHPQLGKLHARRLKAEIAQKTKYQGKILHSGLYKFDKNCFVFNVTK